LDLKRRCFVSDETPQLSSPESSTTNDHPVPPSLWLSRSGKVEVTVYVCASTEDHSLHSILLSPLTTQELKAASLYLVPIKASFTVPTRKKLLRYRTQSSRWVDGAQNMIADRWLMRQCFLRFHLESLDLKDPVTGENIVLERDEDGRLTEKSEEKLEEIHPTFLDMLLGKFERVADIVY
jgi:hypothetical protein